MDNQLTPDQRAWNAFIDFCWSAPVLDRSDPRRNAAIAGMFMCIAGGQGLHTFLASVPEIGATETVQALKAVGAWIAAAQLRQLLNTIDHDLLASSAGERVGLLERFWNDRSDALDALSSEASDELMVALDTHVRDVKYE